jgi:hypothetical protein
MDKQYMMLACRTLRREITAFMEEEKLHYPVFYIPSELHLAPEKLNAYLCDFIPRLVNVDYLLLPMGRCGNGTLGVPSCNTTLVLPKCSDCIDLLLSRDCLSNSDRSKFSYFFTGGWLDDKHSFIREYEHAVEKYGQTMADTIMRTIYNNYKYFTYVDSVFGNFETASAQVSPLAKVVDVGIQNVEATCGVLRKMLKLNFDEDFILVPPGQKVNFEMMFIE